MKKFRVYSSQIVYHEIEIEAENEQQACEIAYETSENWTPFQYGDWDIADVEEIK